MYKTGEFNKMYQQWEKFNLYSLKKKDFDKYLDLVLKYQKASTQEEFTDADEAINTFNKEVGITSAVSGKAFGTAIGILTKSTRLKIRTVNYHTGEVLDEGENKLRYIYWVYFAYHWERIRRWWFMVVNKSFR